ncbi:MAG: MFS transporter [Chloroflexota bacterium]
MTQTTESAPQYDYQADAFFFGVSARLIGIVFVARLITDVSTRMLYPFIPQISAGLGLTVVGFGWVLFLRSVLSVTGPIFGLWSDRYGRRQTMAVGLLLQALGVLGLALSWQWWAALPMLLMGLSLAAFIPAQQAYISDQVTYRKRGRALAAVEFAWSMSAVTALPLAGWLIDRLGWRSPFLLLSLLSLAGAIMVWRRLPPAAERHIQSNISWTETRAIFLRANVLVAVVTATLLFVAGTMFITIWGIWLSTDFQFGATTLGLVGTGVGLAELSGAGLASLIIDRIGKKRGSTLSLLLLIMALLLLPLTRSAVALAVAGLVATSVLFEFTIVSLIPLYSEQVPSARGTVLALTFLGIGVGSAIGAPTTTILWEQFGLGAVFGTAAVCLAVTLGLMRKFLDEGD